MRSKRSYAIGRVCLPLSNSCKVFASFCGANKGNSNFTVQEKRAVLRQAVFLRFESTLAYPLSRNSKGRGSGKTGGVSRAGVRGITRIPYSNRGYRKNGAGLLQKVVARILMILTAI